MEESRQAYPHGKTDTMPGHRGRGIYSSSDCVPDPLEDEVKEPLVDATDEDEVRTPVSRQSQ